MRVEQRIGRVHRLGQKEDVKIYNLCTLGTIEEHIIHLLHEKINMFELVIGELDHILERFEKGDGSLEKRLAKLMLEAGSDTALKEQISQLGSSLTSIRNEVQAGGSLQEAAADLMVKLDALGESVEVRP
ncbi:ATP-dependent helicase HepA [compost metagenome]